MHHVRRDGEVGGRSISGKYGRGGGGLLGAIPLIWATQNFSFRLPATHKTRGEGGEINRQGEMEEAA
jgi:hypothetical protein